MQLITNEIGTGVKVAGFEGVIGNIANGNNGN